MRLTPQQIRNQTFKKRVFGGYAEEEVEEFLAAVETTVSDLISETENLRGIIENLNLKISHLEQEREEVRKLKEQAKAEAEEILLSAQEQYRELKRQLDDERHRLEDEIEIEISRRKDELYQFELIKNGFKRRLRHVLEEFSAIVDSLEQEQEFRKLRSVIDFAEKDYIPDEPVSIPKLLQNTRYRFVHSIFEKEEEDA
ncbi:MAG: hypothetical protein B6D65_03245 [candidate division Zixibacteria bacterium 4484_93]|nr:MAG: hypothetical protein B6D65_03245 [candidate division Zixibacteria bacterium 4484_93]